MAAYDSMYRKLFNAITDVISILQTAQVEAEKRKELAKYGST